MRKNLQYLKQSLEFNGICWTHVWACGARLGLKNFLKDMDMKTAIEQIYEQRTDLWKLKTDPETYTMWQKAQQPPWPTSSLGILLYLHKDRPKCTPNVIQLHDYFSRVNFEQWNLSGSMVFQKMFDWWEKYQIPGYPETTILQVAQVEFDMMNHHVHLIDNTHIDGWLYCIMHSFIQ